MLTDAQIAKRRNGISSSEVAGILGISPFTDPVKIWIDKCAPHLSTRDPYKKFGMLDMGNIMEPVVAKCYCIEHGVTAKKYLDTIQHDKIKWLMCTPDYELSNGRGLECKNVASPKAYEWGGTGTGNVPIYYIVQVQQCMAVLDRQDWAVGAIIGGNEFRHYLIQRDEELIGLMLEAQEQFWTDYILPKKMPPANLGPHSAVEYLKKRFPTQENRETIEIEKDHPLFQAMDRLRELRNAKKLIEEEAALMTAKLQSEIKDGYRLQYGSGKGSISVSWGRGGKGASTNWESLAKELLEKSEEDRAALVQKHTSEYDKSRRFTVTVKGEESEDSGE